MRAEEQLEKYREQIGQLKLGDQHGVGETVAQMDEVAVESELLDELVGGVEDGHARGFVDAAALHADEAVLDDVDPSDAVATADLVELADHLERRTLFAVEGDGNAGLEADRDRFHRVWGFFR